jgi:hypothetical protein
MPKLFVRHGNNISADRTNPNEFDGICEFCGKSDELRPFGPNNENICFDCMMKDEETAKKKFREMLNQQ